MPRKSLTPRTILLATIALAALLWISRSIGPGIASAQEAKTGESRPMILNKPPIRKIFDPNPTPHGVALDMDRGEVFVTNDNRVGGRSILVYPAEFDPAMSDKIMEPKRRISGPKTNLGSICGITLSPEFHEMFTVNNDGGDNMTAFPYEANGNVAPSRELNVPHGAWGAFLETKRDEMFISVEHVNKITVYKRTATGDDDPLRFIQGPKTMLADPHGIYVDSDRNEIYVANHGHYRETKVGEGYQLFGDGKLAKVRGSQASPGIVEPLTPSTGRFIPASITVYPRTANGNVAPIRTIGGSKSGMNLPLGIHLDPVSGQIVVANSGDQSVLFFDRNANGDVAPVRVIKGPATEMKDPSAVFVDTKRNELWVTNWGGHTINVYARTAQGNAAPVRVVRTAAKNAASTGFGNPGTLAYDPKRKEILVPN